MAWLSYTWWNPSIQLPKEAEEDDIDFVLYRDVQKEHNEFVEDVKLWERERDNNLMCYHIELDNLPEDITFEGQRRAKLDVVIHEQLLKNTNKII